MQSMIQIRLIHVRKLGHLCENDWTTETKETSNFQALSLGLRPRQADA
jgi:hypothetical protein